MSYSCKIVADSINEFGCRITSPLTTMPRIILAEFNTHCMFARNSASSRAIKFSKMVDTVIENPFTPLKWMKDHAGMQGTDFFIDPADKEYLKSLWELGRDNAVEAASLLNNKGVTKQLCNRLLEPFMWHLVISTATEWENFFAQRAEAAAEIHMQHIAFMMLEQFNASTPKKLKPGEWHLPFEKTCDMEDACFELGKHEIYKLPELWEAKLSTARCAGTSYTIIGEDGKPESYLRLLKRCEGLVQFGHWSPLEHPSRSMTEQEWYAFYRTIIVPQDNIEEYLRLNKAGHNTHFVVMNDNKEFVWIKEFGWCGKFRGYIQYRKMFYGENRSDERLLK